MSLVPAAGFHEDNMKHPTPTGVKVVDEIVLDLFPLEMRTATNAKGVGGRDHLKRFLLHRIYFQTTTQLVQHTGTF